MSQPIREVDPLQLRLPPSRPGGADPWKLHRQIRQYGSSKDGMPPLPQEPEGQQATRGNAMSETDVRGELLEAFRSLGGVLPEMRVGQLMAALGELCGDLHGRGLWDAEDRGLLEAVWKFSRDLEASSLGKTHKHAFPETPGDS